MLCPTCATELQPADRRNTEIDRCPHCGGLWLDRGELDAIVARAAAPPSQRADRRDDKPGDLGYDPGYYVPRRRRGPSRDELSGT